MTRTMSRNLTLTGGWVTLAASLVGGVLFVDARYAHSDVLTEFRLSQAIALKKMRDEMHYATDQLRKQLLDDKIFEMSLVPERDRSNIQRALLERYKTQIHEINARWLTPPDLQ